MLGPVPQRIDIVDYRSSWRDDFAVLAAALLKALGSRALRIDHIGSTAVPGLAAKDVIDVQVTVESLTAADELDAALAQCGASLVAGAAYHCPPGMTIDASELEKRLYMVGSPRRRANIHVREKERFNQRYALLCRDYLRTHPDAAAAYAAIKRQLSHRFGDDVEAYYDIKDPVFDLIMAAAREWARATDWVP